MLKLALPKSLNFQIGLQLLLCIQIFPLQLNYSYKNLKLFQPRRGLLFNIIGGVGTFSKPFYVHLRFTTTDNETMLTTSDRTWCGGAVVDASWVLTAATCVFLHQNNPSSLFGYTGKFSENVTLIPQNKLHFSKIIVAPGFHLLDNYKDMALLKIHRLRPLPEYRIAQLCVDNVQHGTRIATSGLGVTTRDHTSTAAEKLSEIQFHESKILSWNIFGYQMCRDDLICTMPVLMNSNTCFGDEGSPLYTMNGCENNGVGCILGVAINHEWESGTQHEYPCSKGSYFTSVPFMHEWITKTISEN